MGHQTDTKRASSLDPEEVQFNKHLDSLKQKIRKKIGTDNLDFARLEKAAVPREDMLHLLALTVDMALSRTWAECMRDRKDRLLSIAGRLETLQSGVDKALHNPLMRLPFWSYTAGRGAVLGMAEPKAFTWNDACIGIFTLPVAMRFTARAFRDEAKKFGRFLKKFGRADSQADIGLLLLRIYLFRVMKEGNCYKLTPKSGPDHLNEVARLLTDAFEVAGLNKYGKPRAARSGANPRADDAFSADGLRQVWKRAGRRMLVIWYNSLKGHEPDSHQARPPVLPSPIGLAASGLLPPVRTISNTSSR